MRFKKYLMFSLVLLSPFSNVKANIEDIVEDLSEAGTKYGKISYTLEKEQAENLTQTQTYLYDAITVDYEDYSDTTYKLTSFDTRPAEDNFLYSLYCTQWVPKHDSRLPTSATSVAVSVSPIATLTSVPEEEVIPPVASATEKKGLILLWSMERGEQKEITNSLTASAINKSTLHQAVSLTSFRSLIDAMRTLNNVWIDPEFAPDIRDTTEELELKAVEIQRTYKLSFKGESEIVSPKDLAQ